MIHQRRISALVMPLILVVAGFPSTGMAQSGTSMATGNMSVARTFASAILLENGQVLVAGSNTFKPGSSTADLYDPRTGTFTALGNHGSAIATLLSDGRVLFVVKDSGVNTAEIFDPANGTFTQSGTSVTGQIGGYATLLPNGQVLVAGGFLTRSSVHANPEIYNPATGTFSATGPFDTTGRPPNVSDGPYISAVVRLADGRVLFAGNPSEVYDSVSGSFSLTGVTPPNVWRGLPIDGQTATLLTNGKVLLTGGEDENSVFASAEIYDPATGLFTPTGRMHSARGNHTATLLSDGTVLIAGGDSLDCSPWCTTSRLEVYNPSTGTFTVAGTMLAGRGGQTATLLKNRSVLLTGGYGFVPLAQNLTPFASSEIYTPAGGQPVVLSSAGSLNDFNGDGKRDILRRDSAGNVSIWLMNGNAVMSQTFVANIGPGWSIVGSGDFNGDGKSDILWRDSTGSVAIWLMDGATLASYGTVANVPADWSIAGVGDFNGDGKADILWRHSSGDVRVWLMDGYNIADNTTVANVWTDWSVAGIGDFNGDRKADVLWRSSAGDVAVWLMDGSSVASWSSPGNVPLTTAVAGVADFNGDGKSDILWRDFLGNVSLWLMDGLNVINTSLLANIWTGWAIAGVGDFNGDGNADVLWRDDSGHEVIWSMNGNNIASYGEVQ
jgi:FG-GAP-like repeat/FG-GAP repeat/Galactose oxidase, central domain